MTSNYFLIDTFFANLADLEESYSLVDLNAFDWEPLIVACSEDVLNLTDDVELMEQYMFFETLNSRVSASEINEHDFIWFID